MVCVTENAALCFHVCFHVCAQFLQQLCCYDEVATYGT